MHARFRSYAERTRSLRSRGIFVFWPSLTAVSLIFLRWGSSSPFTHAQTPRPLAWHVNYTARPAVWQVRTCRSIVGIAGSLVHYRYGLFGQSRAGIDLRDKQGRRHEDKRAYGSAVPPWVENPFPAHRRIPKAGPIGRDIIVFKACTQRGKGGVYRAIDLSVSRPREVILKEGRRHGESDWNGLDGFELVRREARALKALRKAAVPVPEVLREFTQSGKRSPSALEKFAGRPLLGINTLHPMRPAPRSAEKCLDQIEPVLARIHAAGWVWRDSANLPMCSYTAERSK